MIHLDTPETFALWRAQARQLLEKGCPPDQVAWGHAGLFADPLGGDGDGPPASGAQTVSRAFLYFAQTVFMHRAPERLGLLYRLLWRLSLDRKLLEDGSDDDVRAANLMVKAVRRDIHKMRAFVRFRAVEEDGQADPRYVAWFEPDHRILRANAGFFARRFANLRWSILTPDLCLHWEDGILRESPGSSRMHAPDGDPAEELWKSYYASTFNPARLKIGMMVKEMPRRYWKNMPETALIPELIAGAQAREASMIALGHAEEDPAPANWPGLANGISACTRCTLHCHASQAVHGEGPHTAALMIVGEQPGDHEDQQGRPFIGPAGQLLDEALADAGIDRARSYVTNAVKHFKFERRGKLRLHQAPSAREIDHCRWWLDAERNLLRPKVIIALGASAARGLMGKTVSVAAGRQASPYSIDGSRIFVTTHPAYILRISAPELRAKAMAEFADDLNRVRAAMA